MRRVTGVPSPATMSNLSLSLSAVAPYVQAFPGSFHVFEARCAWASHPKPAHVTRASSPLVAQKVAPLLDQPAVVLTPWLASSSLSRSCFSSSVRLQPLCDSFLSPEPSIAAFGFVPSFPSCALGKELQKRNHTRLLPSCGPAGPTEETSPRK